MSWARNKRKKLNRRNALCKQCDAAYPRADFTGFYGWHCSRVLSDMHYREHGTDHREPLFCCQGCVEKWEDQHPIICRSHVSFFGTTAGYGIAVQNGNVVAQLPMRPTVCWYPLD